jgi:hypothetical protein
VSAARHCFDTCSMSEDEFDRWARGQEEHLPVHPPRMVPVLRA